MLLYLATIARYTNIIRLLIELGANKKAEDDNSWIPLQLAAVIGHKDIFLELRGLGPHSPDAAALCRRNQARRAVI
ncbi:unnamed protein product [Clonostachys solani]|uniref:Uncharacterized protein n=1 Tax=Clonostachys solani TaxID=160281 RepID=A0A9N9ZHY2_9HYPO|nr:unnamed protein product [Clonostachys solani]